MQLLWTGAFVRAARSAKKTPISHRRAPHPPTPSTFLPKRWSSTQTVAEQELPFPEQSVASSREVDPRKTAASVPFSSIAASKPDLNILNRPYTVDETTNVTNSILSLVGRNLYDEPDHPLCITRKLIESCFEHNFSHLTVEDPVVTVEENFEVLGFPKDHPGRSRTDTYYVNSDHLLRTHTSAHQHSAFQSLVGNRRKSSGYTICADVYRRDSIDRSHFPVFHQMEGARVRGLADAATRYEAQKLRTAALEKSIKSLRQDILNLNQKVSVEDQANKFAPDNNPLQLEHDPDEIVLVVQHLKLSLELLVFTILKAARAASPSLSASETEEIKMRWL